MSIPGGYVFRPSRYSPPIGHAGLDVELTNSPTHEAGTIRAATFPIVTSHLVERTFHPSPNGDDENGEFHVCAGNFRMRRGNDKLVYGFSFGGRLSIRNDQGRAVCRLESPAPIYDLAYELSDSQVFLHSEFVATLARCRATWPDDAGFVQRLIAADPFALFTAVLAALDEYLRGFRDSIWVEDYRLGARTIRRAITTLRACGEWPDMPPTLSGMLGKCD